MALTWVDTLQDISSYWTSFDFGGGISSLDLTGSTIRGDFVDFPLSAFLNIRMDGTSVLVGQEIQGVRISLTVSTDTDFAFDYSILGGGGALTDFVGGNTPPSASVFIDETFASPIIPTGNVFDFATGINVSYLSLAPSFYTIEVTQLDVLIDVPTCLSPEIQIGNIHTIESEDGSQTAEVEIVSINEAGCSVCFRMVTDTWPDYDASVDQNVKLYYPAGESGAPASFCLLNPV